jgi:hypothetical protein
MRRHTGWLRVGLTAGLVAAASGAVAQQPGAPPPPDGGLPDKVGGSSNVHLVSHVPLGGYFRVTDADLEQELSRPYAYVAQSRERAGFSIIDLRDLNNVKVLYRWKIDNVSLHRGLGGLRAKYFKLHGRYYVAECFQFAQGTPDNDLGAIVFDVTGLPDTSKVKVVARIRAPETPGGFHNLFAYKHSDGRVLLFTTTTSNVANVYDMEKVIAGDTAHQLIGKVPVPPNNARGEVLPGFANVQILLQGYHDFYVGYDPARAQDKFYGAGGGGYYVYDVTKPEEPKLITSIVGPAGIAWGHTFTPTPDGNFAVTETEYQWAPLRIFDLRPGLDGKVPSITQPVAVWNADWNDLAHNHEVRWPYVFVSAYEDGLQIFNMQDPAHPKNKGWYYTCECTHNSGYGGTPDFSGQSVYNGAFGVMVRNTDGLIMITDSNTGAWFFKLDGFNGWNGEDWGMPNISSAQDWDHGPPGARPVAGKTAAAP